jgi:ATP-dependent Clp protease ATP-binding subunit ClpA
LIQKEIKNPLTAELLFAKLKSGGRVVVDVDPDGDFSFSFDD